MVLLTTLVLSESTLEGCVSTLFSLTSAAAVQCAIMKPLLRPPSATRNAEAAQAWIDETLDAPFADSSDLAYANRKIVERLGRILAKFPPEMTNPTPSGAS